MKLYNADNFDEVFWQADRLANEGRYKECIALIAPYEDANISLDQRIGAKICHASCELELGNFDACHRLIDSIIYQADDINKLYAEKLRAFALERAGRFSEAELLVCRIISMPDAYAEDFLPDRYQLLRLDIGIKFRLNKYREAVREFEENKLANDIGTGQELAIIYKAASLRALGRREEAKQDLLAVVRMKDAEMLVDAYFWLSTICVELGQLPEAKSALRKAFESYPKGSLSIDDLKEAANELNMHVSPLQ